MRLPWIIDRLLSPELWVFAASLSAILGLVCTVIGFFSGIDWLLYVGIGLFTPLVVGGVVLVVVVIPIAIIANRKHKNE